MAIVRAMPQKTATVGVAVPCALFLIFPTKPAAVRARAAVALGCAVWTGKGVAGAAVTVGRACGGGDDFDNLLHSASPFSLRGFLKCGFSF